MFKTEDVFVVMGTTFRLCCSFGVRFPYFVVRLKHSIHLPTHFHQMYRSMRRLSTIVLLIVITIIKMKVNDFLYSLTVFGSLSKKLTMGLSVICGSLLTMDCNSAFLN